MVQSLGYGYSVREDAEAPFFSRDIQGQIRGTGSPYVVTSFNSGELRFPSGALVPFDCKRKSGPIEVVEPDWVKLNRTGEYLIYL